MDVIWVAGMRLLTVGQRVEEGGNFSSCMQLTSEFPPSHAFNVRCNFQWGFVCIGIGMAQQHEVRETELCFASLVACTHDAF